MTAVTFDAVDGSEVISEDICSSKEPVAVIAIVNLAGARHVCRKALKEKSSVAADPNCDNR